MANPDLTPTKLADLDRRGAAARWAASLALAAVIGIVLLTTPRWGLNALEETSGWWLVDLGRIVLGVANFAAVAAVALSRYRLGAACVLAAVPWALAPLTGVVAWGWWLAVLAVLGIAVFDGARKLALTMAALAVTLALIYCTSEMYWQVPLVGPVNLRSLDPDRWLDELRLSYLAMYLGAVGAVVLAAAVVRRAGRVAPANAPAGLAEPPVVDEVETPIDATGPVAAHDVESRVVPTRPVVAAAEAGSPKPVLTGPWAERIAKLTPREREVLLAVAQGRSNAEVAADLGIGDETVKTHVSEVLRKLGCRDRVQAVIAVYESGLR